MERIASFQVDHTKLLPGIYLSRRDGDITHMSITERANLGVSYAFQQPVRFKGLRVKDLLSNAEMHSVEHVMATLLRNAPQKDAVIYFGPMGCQTGFYFLFDSRRLSDSGAIQLVKDVFAAGAAYDGPMPGKSEAECGNYRNLDVALANAQCAFYRDLIQNWTEADLCYEK